MLEAAKQAVKNEEERPAPFEERTQPFAEYNQIKYQELIDDWFAKLASEDEQPNCEQLEVLHAIRERVLVEKMCSARDI